MGMKKRLLSLLCVLILAASMIPGASAAGREFPDVEKSAWYYDVVTELSGSGIIGGYEDGTFRPDRNITRIELAALAMKAFREGSSRYPDVAQDSEAAKAEQLNPGYWGNGTIAKAVQRGITWFGLTRAEWDQPATRADMALIFVQSYASAQEQELTCYEEAALLIGDYENQVAGIDAEMAIMWLYSSGIVSGMNANGDYQPQGTATRAQACSILYTILHPQRWAAHDWDKVLQDYQVQQEAKNNQVTTGTDFKGKTRTRYGSDVAYDYCRALEEEIGIQIFYLPEWTEKEAGLLCYEDFSGFPVDSEYFQLVLGELKKMKAAYDLYPEGFLKEVAAKKGSRRVEIILCPYTFPGVVCHGQHIYDYSNDAKKVDQIYYTGIGNSQYYSHEMGHMVMSSAAILNGWNATCAQWESYNNGAEAGSYVSAYAMTNRPEDWAETWAFLWHQTDVVAGQIDGGASILRSKVQYMSQILEKNYKTVDASKLPWASVL